MSTIERKPILHGRDHCPGGADPIPCFADFFPLGGEVIYADYVMSLGPIGYWRLGETGSPWVDSTANGNDMTIRTHGVALTPDVTGGLPEAQDDGAVQFNYTGSAVNGGDWIDTAAFSGSLFQINPLTVAAFVNVHAYPANQGLIAGSIGWTGTAYSGWALKTLSTGAVFLTMGGTGGAEHTANSPGAVVLDDWYHVAGTYDGSNIKLYLNGELVATTAYSSGGAFGQTGGVQVGLLDITSSGLYFTGSVDELAVWNVCLTADQIALLSSASVATTTPAGYVLTSDGAGGVSYAAPTIEIEF